MLDFVRYKTDSSDNDDDGIVGMSAISIRASAVADNEETKYPVYSGSSPTASDDDLKSFFAEAVDRRCLAVNVQRSTFRSLLVANDTRSLHRSTWRQLVMTQPAATNDREKLLFEQKPEH